MDTEASTGKLINLPDINVSKRTNNYQKIRNRLLVAIVPVKACLQALSKKSFSNERKCRYAWIERKGEQSLRAGEEVLRDFKDGATRERGRVPRLATWFAHGIARTRLALPQCF